MENLDGSAPSVRGHSYGVEGAPTRDQQLSRVAALTAQITTAKRRLVRGCSLGPEPSDIDFANDEQGNLIYVCLHDPQHRYSLDGQRIS